jgi:hypothetical protein
MMTKASEAPLLSPTEICGKESSKHHINRMRSREALIAFAPKGLARIHHAVSDAELDRQNGDETKISVAAFGAYSKQHQKSRKHCGGRRRKLDDEFRHSLEALGRAEHDTKRRTTALTFRICELRLIGWAANARRSKFYAIVMPRPIATICPARRPFDMLFSFPRPQRVRASESATAGRLNGAHLRKSSRVAHRRLKVE